MYCKKCGKKISDKTRFCDRCGHPSKSGSAVKSTQSSRRHPPKHSSSKRKPDSYDIYRKNKMKREAEKRHREKRRKRISMWLIFFAMILSVGAGFYAYYSMMQNINNGGSDLNDDLKVPSAAEENAENSELVTENDIDEDVEVSGDYYMHIDSNYNFECPYPSGFEVGTTSNQNIRLSLFDPDGDAQMIISCEEIASTQTANNLMRDYVKGIGVDEFESLAGENYYEVTFARNAKINHRKAVIVNEGEIIYYDFVYGNVSDYADQYEEYIEYIDKHFDDMAAGIEENVDGGNEEE